MQPLEVVAGFAVAFAAVFDGFGWAVANACHAVRASFAPLWLAAFRLDFDVVKWALFYA